MKFARLSRWWWPWLLLAGAAAAADFDHAYQQWGAVLAARVDPAGRVDYAALKADPAPLDAALAELAAVPAASVATWSRPQRLALWINAYNAYTLKVVRDHYPIRRRWLGWRHPANSIRQIPGVWDTLTWPVAGERLTLDAMEHRKLRAELAEPRIHFALVCASASCPKLRREPFTAEHLEAQLDAAAREFIATRMTVDTATGRVGMSAIFEWFGEDFRDFGGVSGHGKWDGPLAFVLGHLPEEQAKALRGRRLTVTVLPYDWRLND